MVVRRLLVVAIVLVFRLSCPNALPKKWLAQRGLGRSFQSIQKVTAATSNLVTGNIEAAAGSFAGMSILYEGPIGSDMETAVINQELGVEVSVGPSVISPGRGLYIRVSDEYEFVDLPYRSVICSYSGPGTFVADPYGDKAVAFTLFDPNHTVLYNGSFSTITELIGLVASETQVTDLAHVVSGHELYYDREVDGLGIAPYENATNYFIPTVEVSGQLSEGNIGVYANDLAYHPDLQSEAEYCQRWSRNVLKIVWEVDVDLSPSPLNLNTFDSQYITAMPSETTEYLSSTNNDMAARIRPKRPVLILSDYNSGYRSEKDCDNESGPIAKATNDGYNSPHGSTARISKAPSGRLRGIRFTNRKPMEIGLTYSWIYWQVFRNNIMHHEQ